MTEKALLGNSIISFWRASLRGMRKIGAWRTRTSTFSWSQWLRFYGEVLIAFRVNASPENIKFYKCMRVAIKSGILSDTLFFFPFSFFLQHPLIWILTNSGTSVSGRKKAVLWHFKNEGYQNPLASLLGFRGSDTWDSFENVKTTNLCVAMPERFFNV